MTLDPALTEDATLFAGRLRLRQLRHGHRVGTDSVLLSAALDPAGGHLIDAGAGAGLVGLAIAQRQPGLNVTLVERDEQVAEAARQNIELNGLSERMRVAACDLTHAASRRAVGLSDGCADALVTNPPWLDPHRAQISPDQQRAAAHAHGDALGLETWMRAMAALLRPGGRFALIHRADALKSCLDVLEGRFGALEILPLHPRAHQPAHRIIIRGIKGSRAPTSLLPAFVVHQGDRFTPEAEAIHKGEALLPGA
jgi:tRNA1(Val) A37 N6-methylase TrmN6